MVRKCLLSLYITTTVMAGAVVLYHSFGQHLPWAAIAFFVAITLLAEALPVDTPYHGISISASFGLIYAALFLFGPAGGAVVASLGTISWADLRYKAWYRNLFNLAQLAICAYLAGTVYLRAGGEIGRMLFPADILPVVLAFGVHFLLNSTFTTLASSLFNYTSFAAVWRKGVLWNVPSLLVSAPFGALMASVYQGLGVWAVLLFLVPLLVARQSFHLYRQMRNTYVETIHTLAHAIEAKDNYTRGHSERVAVYANAIARRLGLPQNQIDLIYFISLLHDVGKIGIPEQILNKTERLDQTERAEINRHSEIGAGIVREISFLRGGIDVIRYHHERFDGAGYPVGIKGAEIPIGARIIAVADAFDAMTSERVYRHAKTVEQAMEELRLCAGGQFDPEVVGAFTQLLREQPQLVQVPLPDLRLHRVV